MKGAARPHQGPPKPLWLRLSAVARALNLSQREIRRLARTAPGFSPLVFRKVEDSKGNQYWQINAHTLPRWAGPRLLAAGLLRKKASRWTRFWNHIHSLFGRKP